MAAVAVAATIAAGPVSAAARADGKQVAQIVNNNATEPSLSLAVGPKGVPEVAAIGKHATLLYYTIVRGKWRHTQVAGPGTAQSGPSLVSLGGGNAAIAVEGPTHLLLIFTLRNGHWKQRIIAGPGAWSAPSLAEGPHGLELAVLGPKNSLWFYDLLGRVGTTTEILGPNGAYSAPSLVVRGAHRAATGDPASEADIAVEGSAHDLVYLYGIPGLTSWNSLVGESLAYSAPSLLVTDGADFTQGIAYVVVEGPHHRLVLFSDEQGTVFTYNSAATNNTVYSAPSVAQNLGDSRRPLVIAYQGRASKVFDVVLFKGSTLTKYDVVGSVHADSAPAAAAGAPTASTADVIVEGAGNTLWYFHGARPSSGTGVPKFTAIEVGGGGTTFGG
jgi:hypothetical protein